MKAQEIAKTLLSMGGSIEDIVKATKLSTDEIQRLSKTFNHI